jgi:hypothetical protein
VTDTPHESTPMVWSHRDNSKHKHNTRHGVRHRNHWFNVYKCPACGRTAALRRQPIICRGVPLPPLRTRGAADNIDGANKGGTT